MRLDVSLLDSPSPSSLPVEVVERKGLGHPDTLCDALAENLSRQLSRFYLEHFGAVLHHNVDKALLAGGAARPAFGGGEVLEPIELYLAGRATRELQGVRVPVDELAVEATKAWLRANLRHLDVDAHLRVLPRIRPTSPDLAALFLRQGQAGVALANDTSIGVGFAPCDELESAVLAVERALTAPQARARLPAIGEDVKVMGARHGAQLSLTVACAMVGRHLADLAQYRAAKDEVRRLALDAARTATAAPVECVVNAADGDTPDSVYLTVTGLSAESGDDGQVGRGNRVSGLITPYRPMSLEAAAGKNPVSHVGKLYNVVAGRIARAVVAEVGGVREATVTLLSRIGAPVTEPAAFDVRVRLDEPSRLAALRPRVEEVARAGLAAVTTLWRESVTTGLEVW